MGASPVFAKSTDLESSAAPEESVRQMLSGWPYLPYSHCREVRAEGRFDYLLASLACAQRRGAATWNARVDGQVQGLAQWELLPWDTQMLGFAVARISALYRSPSPVALTLQQELLEHILEEVRGAGVHYLMIRVPAGDTPAIEQLENLGFRMVDGILSFGRTLEDLAPARGAPVVRVAEPQDFPALREIAAASFSIDRFHSDPAIGKVKADEVHRAWVDNACRGRADCVLVAASDGELAGFTTLQLDGRAETTLGVKVGVVELVASSPRFRRRGIAHALALSSLRWFRDAGCGWAEVGTQVANVHAARLYQSAGFRLSATSLTFRLLL